MLNKKLLLEKVRKIKDYYDTWAIPLLAEHEIHPDVTVDSKERYLYFTLPVCLNFQRSSTAMRKSAYATYHDPCTQYLFDPHQVVEKTFEQLQADLTKHKLALQKNKHVQIWQRICQSMVEWYDGDVRKLLADHEYDVLQVVPYLRENKKSYPYLNGPKMSNYRLYILDKYTDIEIVNKDMISIIPDTHVQQASKILGVVEESASIDEINQARYDLLKWSEITPVEMHPPLWNRSRNDFNPSV